MDDTPDCSMVEADGERLEERWLRLGSRVAYSTAGLGKVKLCGCGAGVCVSKGWEAVKLMAAYGGEH